MPVLFANSGLFEELVYGSLTGPGNGRSQNASIKQLASGLILIHLPKLTFLRNFQIDRSGTTDFRYLFKSAAIGAD